MPDQTPEAEAVVSANPALEAGSLEPLDPDREAVNNPKAKYLILAAGVGPCQRGDRVTREDFGSHVTEADVKRLLDISPPVMRVLAKGE